MRHEDIQRIYRNHYLISRRDMGSVRQLVGSIDVIVFFVNDSQSTWTDYAKQQYRAVQKEAMQKILQAARTRGVSLQIRNAYVEATVSMNCTLERYDVWTNAVIRKYGVPDIPAYQRKHKAVKQCMEAPILFVLNKPFLCSTAASDWETRQNAELSVISSQYSTCAIMHELLHQFGAMDLYYPDEVRNLIHRMGYESVMYNSNSTYIDSLTAYLIGWTAEIDGSAVKILERTKHLTKADMLAAARRQYQKS